MLSLEYFLDTTLFYWILQVYSDLNIVTAKASLEEQRRVPHHLLNVATSHDPFTVQQFQGLALPIVCFFYKYYYSLRENNSLIVKNQYICYNFTFYIYLFMYYFSLLSNKFQL